MKILKAFDLLITNLQLLFSIIMSLEFSRFIFDKVISFVEGKKLA